MRNLLFLGLLGATLGGGSAACFASPLHAAVAPAVSGAAQSTVARLVDRGTFLNYSASGSHAVGASTWHPVQLSEAHAINAIAQGGMVVAAPDGHAIPLQFVRRVVHQDGTWTWIGRPVGGSPGQEAILTFGPKAVFGSIPNGKGLPLQLATRDGRVWMVETDQTKLAPSRFGAGGSDVVDAPASLGVEANRILPPSGPGTPGRSGKTLPSNVDLVLGYTPAFATRWGGQSQAATRLSFLVDIANQGLRNSQVNGQFTLLHTVEVNVADNTQNRSMLYALSGVNCTITAAAGQRYLPDSGVNCTAAAVPAALQPLLQARQQYGADLTALVRNYVSPDNQTCGVAWLLGGAQHAFDASSADFALAVVSDSGGSAFPSNGNTCRDETLAHELGHNMGLAHDPVAAAGSDDSNSDGNLLDPEEYGRFSNSFGYKTGANAGNFYDIMGVPSPGQTSYRVYSNPRITTCGGFACGDSQSDAAGTLNATMPLVQQFRSGPASSGSPKLH